jgi:ABC-type transport system involved in cytochrome bd biosynthesis fused ATPase/permease subunit
MRALRDCWFSLEREETQALLERRFLDLHSSTRSLTHTHKKMRHQKIHEQQHHHHEQQQQQQQESRGKRSSCLCEMVKSSVVASHRFVHRIPPHNHRLAKKK